MPERIYIPDEVMEDISDHVRDRVAEAVADFYLAGANEDALTGYLGRSLRMHPRTVEVAIEEVARVWTWSISYASFSSSGPGAAERLLGADGVIELEVDSGFRVSRKSLLFQAKKLRDFSGRLFRQAVLLLTWREAACIIDYSPDEYRVYGLDDVLIEMRGKTPKASGEPLAQFISGKFLRCLVGDTELRYWPHHGLLSWRDMTDVPVVTEFNVAHQIKIDVAALPFKMLTADEVHDHRMKAEERDILSVPRDAPPKAVNDARKHRSKAVHLDGANDLSELERAILNRQNQEINHAADVLTGRSKKRSDTRGWRRKPPDEGGGSGPATRD